MQAPVSVMETAGEGGAWGIALLASYAVHKEEGETLEAYLNSRVFGGDEGVKMEPDAGDMAGFETFIERFKEGLSVEQEAVRNWYKTKNGIGAHISNAFHFFS